MFDYKMALDQLSGGANGQGKLKAMLGARQFVTDKNWVSFAFKGSRKANKVKITLTAGDEYIMEFYKVPTAAKLGKMDDDAYDKAFEPIKKVRVQVDGLKKTFEKFTGLRTSL